MSASPPQAAATVVLLRQETDGLAVFLVQRHAEIAFMGGAHVFPGGRVETADCDPAYAQICEGVETATSPLTDTGDVTPLGFCVAAVRETFEEAGVLLATDAAGESITLNEPGMDAPAARAAITAGGTTLLALLNSRGWRLAVGRLVYFAHWVTPAVEARRFDTRFFLAEAPAQQVAVPDHTETTDGLWIRPADALARCRRGEIALPPPTWTTLRWLEDFDDVDAALGWARSKPVPRIEPGFIRHPDGRIVTLPGDVTMAPVDGLDLKETRFLLADGRWTPVSADQQT